ncbi:MAG: cysteine desulfurase NifS [Anaerovoracaceae bacterium]|nr:cysteine desulfurase NifS [Anaerovoracaceae bacterium]
MRQVYLDYSATTPVKKEVLDEMLPYFCEKYGNPSSLYSLGEEAAEAVATARKRLAHLINADEDEVYFTSCGSESDNWALFGVTDARKKDGNHIITSSIEHHAILHSCEYLSQRGVEVTYLPIDKNGRVSPEDLEKAIKPGTVLVSIMLVNNEIGTVQPIKKLAEIAHRHGATFHCDAVQGLGNVPIDVKDLGIDLMSFSSHKIYGPKGVGAMYMKKGTKISNYLHGGAQEKSRRAGTENTAGIVGFGKAAELAEINLKDHIERVSGLRDYFIEQVKKNIPDIIINGTMDGRHPGNANITFKYIEGESILILLNEKGICISTGSACSSKSLKPSHVLTALGVPDEMIHGSCRFTVGDFTTKDDIDYTVECLTEIVEKLRSISSLR